MTEQISDINTKIKVSPYAAMRDPIYQRNQQLSKYQVDEHQALRDQTRQKVATQQTIKSEVPRLTALEKGGIQRKLSEADLASRKEIGAGQKKLFAESEALRTEKMTHAYDVLDKKYDDSGQGIANIIDAATIGLSIYEHGDIGPDSAISKLGIGPNKTQQLATEFKQERTKQTLINDSKLQELAGMYMSFDPWKAHQLISNISDVGVQSKLLDQWAIVYRDTKPLDYSIFSNINPSGSGYALSK